MYIAVCDDQIEELEKVKELLDAWRTERGSSMHYKTYRSAAELLDAARRERFTLYLLDVLMPGMTGMDAAREIRTFDAAAEIVFLTTSPGFAYESYGVRAIDYLLKPLNSKLLYPVLDRLHRREQKPQDGLTVKSEGVLLRLPFAQLTYVEVNGKHLYFNMADGSVHEVSASLKEYSGALRAVSELPEGQRHVSLYCGVRQNKLLIEVRNPYAGTVYMKNGVPASVRGEGHGYGCRSIQTIAERNGGLCVFTAQDKEFCMQAMLPVLER